MRVAQIIPIAPQQSPGAPTGPLPSETFTAYAVVARVHSAKPA